MRTAALVLLLLTALTASPASACRVPNPVRTLFDAPPSPLPYEGRLYHGRLTNQTDAFRDAKINAVLKAGGLIVGEDLAPFAVLTGPDAASMPIYAQIFSSCADLSGLYGTPFDREVWIVGRPIDPADDSKGVQIMGWAMLRGQWEAQ